MKMKTQISLRILSVVLAMAMVVGMLPSFTFTAYAVVPNTRVIAWNDTDNDGVIDNRETTYTNLTTALNAGGTVKLTGDEIILASQCMEDQYLNLKDISVTLDLNGRYLAFESMATHKGIYLSGSAKLTITDSAGGGVVETGAMHHPFGFSDTAQLIVAGGYFNAGYCFHEERG
jgi:hypothetical protein